jgi:hypothetical protein
MQFQTHLQLAQLILVAPSVEISISFFIREMNQAHAPDSTAESQAQSSIANILAALSKNIACF